MSRSCGTCAYSQSFADFMGWKPEDHIDEPDERSLSCRYPASSMPLCMQGYAQREREQVAANATGCPVWQAKVNLTKEEEANHG